MREIKFRIPMFTDKGTFIEFQYIKLGDDIEGTLCGHNGEPQQYTGLKDKNGKEIYEGDIIEHTKYRFAVPNITPLDRTTYFDETITDDWMSMSDIDWEIIGNIYENPELLK